MLKSIAAVTTGILSVCYPVHATPSQMYVDALSAPADPVCSIPPPLSLSDKAMQDSDLPLLAEIESGGAADPYTALNPESSATGKYQIILSTALYAARNLEPHVREWAEPALRVLVKNHDRNGYRRWLALHPGLQEQLAYSYLQDIKRDIRSHGLRVTSRRIAIAWQYPGDPDGRTDEGHVRDQTVKQVMRRMHESSHEASRLADLTINH